MKREVVFPKRPNSHVVGDMAVDIFISACNESWVISPVQKDYGLDLRIEIGRGDYVSGEEFGVQIKGRTSINDTDQRLPKAKIKQATINYWLGKLAPTMVAVVDPSTKKIFYDWLEYCYPDYPNMGQSDENVYLSLRHISTDHDIKKEIATYLRQYYGALSKDMESLSNGIFLSNLLFSISAMHRVSTRAAIDLQQIEFTDSDELKSFLGSFCFALSSHDHLMEGLRNGAFGHLPKRRTRFLTL